MNKTKNSTISANRNSLKMDSRTTTVFKNKLKSKLTKENKKSKKLQEGYEKWSQKVEELINDNPIFLDRIRINRTEYDNYEDWSKENKKSSVKFEILSQYINDQE